jgi:hypothetical protein
MSIKKHIDIDGIEHMPRPLCTYSDHSYPSYSKLQFLELMRQRDDLFFALKSAVCAIKGREHTGNYDSLISEIEANK